MRTPYKAVPLPPLDPDMDASDNHYWSYHSLDALLACKQPLTASQDEDLFIAIHQICELAFHQMIIDMGRVLDALREALGAPGDGVIGDTAEAVYFLRRVNQLWRVPSTAMPILGGMRGFAEFRTSIGPTSGFQSFQFRHLEIMSGIADRYWRGGTADAEGNVHVAESEFDRRHGDDIEAWLEEHATHSLRHYYEQLLERALAAHPDAALAALKRDAQAAPVLELMAEYDRQQSRFHRSHLELASKQLRIVGADVGTGGTAFRDYLAKYEREMAPLFPELSNGAAEEGNSPAG